MPRHDVGMAIALMPAVVDVQVRELNVLGLLLHAAEPIEIGSRGLLRMTLSGVPFEADVQIRRVARSRAGERPGYAIAATFVAISPEHRQLIERFVTR